MQFNPAYWEQDARIGMIALAACVMLVYPIAKYTINEMRE